MSQRIAVACVAMACMAASAFGGEPTYVQGKNIFIETGVDAPDRTPTWYAPMAVKPYAPVFEILATRGTEGRYYPYTYAVTLKDMIKWHGHDCEGTIHAANAAKVAFEILFPDGIIDRSVLWGISGASPCWSDAVAFLTGARVQYGNLGFFKSKDYGHAILLYREDTGVAVLATWKKGINNIPGEPVVLPESITWKPKVSMEEVMKLK
ncbi:MAG: formylmethanofuran dehydrogenase subunit E family protein, partial [Burkholderiales bacterium]